MPYVSVASPVGPLTVFEDDGAIVAVEFGRVPEAQGSPLLEEAKRQLSAFFERRRTGFNLPLNPAGSRFQQAVWQAIRGIPYGETRSYGDLAADLDSVARAVGGACGRNPIPIIVPCHRVVGANGRLTGFSGGEGVATKRALLEFEQPTDLFGF